MFLLNVCWMCVIEPSYSSPSPSSSPVNWQYPLFILFGPSLNSTFFYDSRLFFPDFLYTFYTTSTQLLFSFSSQTPWTLSSTLSLSVSHSLSLILCLSYSLSLILPSPSCFNRLFTCKILPDSLQFLDLPFFSVKQVHALNASLILTCALHTQIHANNYSVGNTQSVNWIPMVFLPVLVLLDTQATVTVCLVVLVRILDNVFPFSSLSSQTSFSPLSLLFLSLLFPCSFFLFSWLNLRFRSLSFSKV